MIISSTSHAMELAPLTSTKKKNFQINCIQDIPKLSLKDIRPCFNILPETKRNKFLTTKNQNNVTLAELFTFFIALLEEPIKLDILTFMMDGDKTSAQLFYNTPLWYAQSRYHSAKKMIERSSLTKQPVSLLFRLSMDQQKEIMGIITPTLAAHLVGDTMIMLDEDKARVIQSYGPEIQENFFDNENIKVVDYSTQKCLRKKTALSAFLGVLTGGVIGVGIASLSDNPIAHVAIVIISGYVGFWVVGIGGSAYCTYITKEKAPKIEI
jgi:hypothetical protein